MQLIDTDTPFMEALEAHLARTLPMGALVLLRGKRFPGGTWAEPGTGASRRGMQPVLETRIVNRMHQFYGYRIADAGAAPLYWMGQIAGLASDIARNGKGHNRYA